MDNILEIIKLAQSEAIKIYGETTTDNLLVKLFEEVAELSDAIGNSDGSNFSSFEIQKEFGDVLFCMARMADVLKIDFEKALSLTVVKIQERSKLQGY